MQVKSRSFQVILQQLLSATVPALSVATVSHSDELLFLDAREAREYEVSHIKGARLVGYSRFDIRTMDDVNKSQAIVVYCSIGKRSEDIVRALLIAGFVNVHNLYGGIFEWVNQGCEVVNDKEAITDKVHVYNRFFGRWLRKGTKIYG